MTARMIGTRRSGPAVPNEVVALQAALAADHAALYAVGVAGAYLPKGRSANARALYEAHRARRDSWTARLVSLSQTPTPAAPAYRLPSVVTGPSAATALIRLIEQRAEPFYAELVEATAEAATRAAAVTALVDTAVSLVGWGGPAQALPGN